MVFLEPALAGELGELLLAQRWLFGLPIAGPVVSEQFSDRYFAIPGTPGAPDSRVLRRRERAGQTRWQLKTAIARRGNEALFETLEAPGGAGVAPPELALEGLAPEPLLEARVARRSIRIEAPGGGLLVSVDRCDYRTPSGSPLGSCFEVEVKSAADNTSIDPFVEHLRVAFGLVPATRSKLEKGLALARAARRPRRAVLLDMDPGVDDAIALLLALASPELSLLAVTTVGGNVALDQTTRNACLLVQHGCRLLDVRAVPPIAAGETPSGEMPDASDVHGADGLGGWASRCAEPELQPTGEPAAELIARLLAERPGEITLVSTGPLTNLARCAERHPSDLSNARELLAMGGVFFQPGNRSSAAEFNVHRDPGAAAALVSFARERPGPAGAPRLPHTFVGLDVTHRVRLFRSDLAAARGAVPDLLREITGTYMDFYRRNEGLDGCYLHDPLAVALAIDPSLCEVEPFHVEVETAGTCTTGSTLADSRPTRLFGQPEARVTGVCVTVDAERARRTILGRLGLLDIDSTTAAGLSAAPTEGPYSKTSGDA